MLERHVEKRAHPILKGSSFGSSRCHMNLKWGARFETSTQRHAKQKETLILSSFFSVFHNLHPSFYSRPSLNFQFLKVSSICGSALLFNLCSGKIHWHCVNISMTTKKKKAVLYACKYLHGSKYEIYVNSPRVGISGYDKTLRYALECRRNIQESKAQPTCLNNGRQNRNSESVRREFLGLFLAVLSPLQRSGNYLSCFTLLFLLYSFSTLMNCPIVFLCLNKVIRKRTAWTSSAFKRSEQILRVLFRKPFTNFEQ